MGIKGTPPRPRPPAPKRPKAVAIECTSMENQCSNCRFWVNITEALDSPEVRGLCRRYPPNITSDKEADGNHPVTYPYDWCGEWLDAV